MEPLIGKPIRRKEDLRLITGNGCYSDDVHLPGESFMAVVRSPHAHARIVSIDVSAAAQMPGVLGVIVAADLQKDGVKPIPPDFAFLGSVEQQRRMPDVVLINRDERPIPPSPYYPLAVDRVRYVGDAVAIVIAESIATAKDAAEQVDVTYEVLPAVIETSAAASSDAPLLWPAAGSNVVLEAEVGDPAATEAAFAEAAVVVKLETWIRRVTGVPMEPRSCIGAYDSETGRFTLHAGSGGVVRQKTELAHILGVAFKQVRVTARDIGGNFGTKNSLYPEFVLVLWAARQFRRPVKWTCERQEALLTDFQGRDLVAAAELALDRDGRFLAMRGDHLSNLGAYATSIIPLRKGVGIVSGLYRIPAAHFTARAVLSNTPPTIPYRSAGRPEAMFIVERLCDLAAAELGIDPIALRRRNLVSPEEMPYRNPVGVTYDSGEYATSMDRGLALADWSGFPARQAEAAARGQLRGIGFANYIEMTMGFPRERAEVTILPSGQIEVVVGTLSSGQGHETSFAQCVGDWLGQPLDRISIIQGDTDKVPVGGGSHSGRSMRLAGIVMGKATDGVIRRGRQIAAHLFETDDCNVEFADGRFTSRVSNRVLELGELAAAAAAGSVPDALAGPLRAACDETFTTGGFPYGCAVCEVEIDPETGSLRIVRYTAVDDVGRAINPLILHGQTHGAIVQGVGQALWEVVSTDPVSGQVLSGSFMDYAMPRADYLPSFTTDLMEVPSPTNPLGVRAGGEGGTTPALAVVINAVVDALKDYGVRHMEMPATSAKIWTAIQAGKRERQAKAQQMLEASQG
jgi:aerobic carbon-monoxide dehydrogenase large subunit